MEQSIDAVLLGVQLWQVWICFKEERFCAFTSSFRATGTVSMGNCS